MTGIPVSRPATAATRPAMASDRKKRSGSEPTLPCSSDAATAPENAPTLMKPACPSDSSPEMPTTRLSEMVRQM